MSAKWARGGEAQRLGRGLVHASRLLTAAPCYGKAPDLRPAVDSASGTSFKRLDVDETW
jgi:hypothetical protein